ncbi:hypothetical protein QT971_28915, partial [Microcoleus sp. herbarium19]
MEEDRCEEGRIIELPISNWEHPKLVKSIFYWCDRLIQIYHSDPTGNNSKSKMGGCISILQGRSISVDNLLVRIKDLLPKCFAPTNIFAKMRC